MYYLDIMERTDDRITLVLGGTRSGKSAYAESLLPAERDKTVLYVATAECRQEDAAMVERIRRHRVRRPAHWQTLESQLHVGRSIEEKWASSPCDVVMIDCISMLASNVMFSLDDEENLPELEQALRKEALELIRVMKNISCRWILVSGETGLGIVAPTKLGRNYCDALGMCNQLLAAEADRVVLVVAGRPLDLPAVK